MFAGHHLIYYLELFGFMALLLICWYGKTGGKMVLTVAMRNFARGVALIFLIGFGIFFLPHFIYFLSRLF